MKEKLLKVENAKLFEEIPILDWIYIIPTRRKHESGYMCMEIIGVNKRMGYEKKLATFSDVIDLDKIITKKDNCFISIDMPEYNVIRVFSHIGRFKVTNYGISTFSFELVDEE